MWFALTLSKSERTRAHIVEQAALLFNQQGYAGTSMSDLMVATGLKKGGLYNHFPSKDDLALAAFDYAIAHMQKQFREAIRGKRHAIDRLLAILRVYEHMAEQPPLPGGCPILNTAIESDDTHPALRDRTCSALNQWRHLMKRIISKGIQRGELSETVEAEQVATVLISTLEGAVMMSKLYEEDSYIHRAIAHLETYLQQLRSPP